MRFKWETEAAIVRSTPFGKDSYGPVQQPLGVAAISLFKKMVSMSLSRWLVVL